MMDMNDNHLADDFSNHSAMLPPRENADARSDQNSKSFDDMNEGLVHHLPMHLLNSASSTNILNNNCDSSSAKILNNPPKRR